MDLRIIAEAMGDASVEATEIYADVLHVVAGEAEGPLYEL